MEAKSSRRGLPGGREAERLRGEQQDAARRLDEAIATLGEAHSAFVAATLAHETAAREPPLSVPLSDRHPGRLDRLLR